MSWKKRAFSGLLAGMIAVSGMFGSLSSAEVAGPADAPQNDGSASYSPASDRFNFESATILSPADFPDFAEMHPRLFVMPWELDELREKIWDPQFYPHYLTILQDSSHPLSQAFQYLVTEDEQHALQAIDGMLTMYRSFSDATVEDRGRSYITAYTYGPMVYDWCYDLLTEEQKQEFIEHFMRAVTFPNKPPGFPIDKSANTITGHHTAGWFYNQFWMGLAIYDEDPRMWDGALEFFLEEHQHVLNFMFPSGISEQGWYISRHAYPTHFILLANRLSGGKHIVDTSHKVSLDQLLYYLRPDGQQIRSGDVAADTSGSEEYKYTMLEILGNMYHDGYYKTAKQFFAQRDPVLDSVLEILIRPQGLEEKELAELPLVRHFPEPIGSEMIARSGWDTSGAQSDDYVVQMRIGNTILGGHQHLDFGTFQIYYKGPLTGHSGAYRGSQTDHGQAHWRNYYRSTISKNGLIIYNPNQRDGTLWQDPQNDGGIHFPRTSGSWDPGNLADLANPRNEYSAADLLAHGTDEADGSYRYAYISGDLTKGYQHASDPDNPDRADNVTRSMVTMPTAEKDHPLTFFVFDRINATDESFLKKFIMHTADEPVIAGNKVESSAARTEAGYDGKLTSWTLLPKLPSLEVVEGYKVGYGDKEVEYPIGTPEGRYYEEFPFRLEVSNPEAVKEERFLHAMTVSEDGTAVEAEATLIESGNAVGAQLLDNMVLFSKRGNPLTEVSFELPGSGTQNVLVTDLVPGTYLVDRTDRTPGDFIRYAEVTNECKCLFFEGSQGSYYVTRASITEDIAERLIAARGGDSEAPAVSIAAVPDTVSGATALTANASDNVGIAGIQFRLNGKNIGSELQSAPFTLSWDSTSWPDGTYALTAVARDAAGHTAMSEPVAITVHNDPGFVPLYESFADDADGFTVSGSWSVSNGNYILESESGGLAVHERSFADDLSLQIEARLMSRTNGSRELQAVFDYVDANNYAYVTLSEDAEESGIYKRSGGATERLGQLNYKAVPGAKVELNISRIGGYIDVYVDGVLIGQGFDESLSGGQVGIGSPNSAARFDSVSVTPIIDGVEVDVTAPEVGITMPDEGAIISGMVDVRAWATDNRGVANVQFAVNGIHLGASVTSETEVYANTWNTTVYPNGTYALTVIGRDTVGNEGQSEPVIVTINNEGNDPIAYEDFSEGADRFEFVRGGSWSVVDGQLVVTNANNMPTNGNIALHETTMSGDYMITMDAANTASPNGFRDFSVIFEYRNPNEFYFVNFSQQSNGSTGGIFKSVGGNRVHIANLTIHVHPPTMHSVAVVREGASIRAYVNGELAGVATDDTYMSGGKVGLGTINDATVFDNFSIVGLAAEPDVQPPVAAFLSPADGSEVSGTVTLSVSAHDNMGVAGVQLLLNGDSMGSEVQAAPYELDWDTTSVADGEYTIGAVARDLSGNLSEVATIAVTVNNSVTGPIFWIEETFTTDADRFEVIAGGWEVIGGVYALNAPDRSQTTGNGNLTVHEREVTGDFVIEMEARSTANNNGFRDYSIVFDYADEQNYMYVSMHQNPSTAGIFKVENGQITQLAAMTGGIKIGQWQQVKVVRAGELITVYLAGELVGSVEEAGYGAGKVGLGSLNDPTDYDNFRVTASEPEEPREPISVVRGMINAAPRSLPADGVSEVQITVRLRGDSNRFLGVSAGELTILTTHGSISETIDHQNGTYSAMLTAPKQAGIATISLELEGEPVSANNVRINFRKS